MDGWLSFPAKTNENLKSIPDSYRETWGGTNVKVLQREYLEEECDLQRSMAIAVGKFENTITVERAKNFGEHTLTTFHGALDPLSWLSAKIMGA